MEKFCRVQKSIVPPKCELVDTNPHASCVPGTIGTNNTAFLLYGSGLDYYMGIGLIKTRVGYIMKPMNVVLMVLRMFDYMLLIFWY